MSRKLVIVILILVGICPIMGFAKGKGMQTKKSRTTAATAASADVFPFKVSEKTLPNGLKVIVVPTGFPNIVSLQIPVQTGSRNEVEPGKSGFAHFFEHIMFRGTKTYPAKEYQAILTKVGARQNAFTSNDFTNYHTTFAKDDLDLMLKVEADRFMNLEYSVEDFKTESRAVLGEYNKNSADPFNKLEEVQHDNAYTTHTYKHTTMGFIRDIEDMPNQYEYSREFFKRWYRPENTTIIIAGDVEPRAAFALVEKYWSVWQKGDYKVTIPTEPIPKGSVYAHVPWQTPTLPIVTVGFHAPAFSDTDKEYAAMDLLMDLYFGPTSDIYRRLVEQEQKVDQFIPDFPAQVDPPLDTVYARIKDIKDSIYVRNLMMETFTKARNTLVDEKRLAEAKSSGRYGFARRLDNTEEIAATLARFVHFQRSAGTINNLFRTYASITPADIQAAAKKYFTDERLVLTTLSKEAMPTEISRIPPLSSLEAKPASSNAQNLKFTIQKSVIPLVNMKLVFSVGSAYDPAGKEGLAALAAAMITNAGSKDQRIDEISKAYFPMAASFSNQVDREMTTFTGIIHKDNLNKFADIALKQLTDPGFREDDFKRLKESQINALTQDLRASNDEELGKERLQQNIFAGTPYGHPTLGTVAGIESITVEDVQKFIRTHYTQNNLLTGLAGDVPEEFVTRLKKDLGSLSDDPAPTLPKFSGHKANGMEVEIIQKDTIATAISLGFPIEVTRSHPDFAALWLSRAWLGEHRSSVSHLYNRIREIRGMNYGDYAYIEAFPRGMFQFFPDANIARRSQIFEIWIRPVVPTNAHFALRIATAELEKLINDGMSEKDFQAIRDYLMKNVYVMTATQDQQIGYALDSQWYNIDEFATYMRKQLQALTVDDVNRAIRKHLNAKNMNVVMITKDAAGLKQQLLADGFSPIKYEAQKPAELLEEDKVIGARKLNISPDAVRVTPVDNVFAK